MLDLLAEVSAHLAARGVAHALVGAGALAIHGVSRSTFDLDLLAAPVPVVDRADLVLLKLFAGGPQDAWDIQQLLGAGERASLVGEVEARLGGLPAEASALWARSRGG